MFRKVDKSAFEGLTEVDPVVRFKIGYPANEDAFAQAVWKDVIAYCKFGKNKEAYKVMFLDGNTLERKWFYMTPKLFKYLKRWNDHCEERVEKGASYRDAWDIHWWLSRAMSEALHSLRTHLHGFPTCAVDLWNKLAEITGDEKIDEKGLETAENTIPSEKKLLDPADVKNLALKDESELPKLDVIRFYTWKRSLEVLERLFREYNEDTCSKKNPYKFVWKYKFVPCKDHPGLSELVWNGTGEEHEEHDRYMNEAIEIDKYRSECLHKAMKVLEIFIEHLWD